MSHSHSHSHDPAEMPALDRAFAIGVVLNTVFVAAEATAGWWSNSLALLADAGHNLSDILALLLAWGASVLTRRAPTLRRTYGWRRSSILAALANALLLLVAVGAIAWEAVERVQDPQPTAGTIVLLVAGVGIFINTATALLFIKGRHDVNVRGAFLHMAADAAVSAGVVVAALIQLSTGWLWLDPAASLLIAVVIAISTWGLLRESLDYALDAVPGHIDPDAVRAYLESLPGVTALHDLHIWGMSTTEIALTVHLVRPEGGNDAFIASAMDQLLHRFGIHHVTLQVERGIEGFVCTQTHADGL
ncbi:MAG TPA: cation diffusion facilitator family transporter [Hyphomicrobiales bacterium]|nr:cation diffusion facilitator family transporter [Hyphomicrobiales bacterium]